MGKEPFRGLTPDQLEAAQDVVEACGLEDIANDPLTINGRAMRIVDGIGYCLDDLLEKGLDPNQIADLMRLAHKTQQTTGSVPMGFFTPPATA